MNVVFGFYIKHDRSIENKFDLSVTSPQGKREWMKNIRPRKLFSVSLQFELWANQQVAWTNNFLGAESSVKLGSNRWEAANSHAKPSLIMNSKVVLFGISLLVVLVQPATVSFSIPASVS